MEIAVAFRSMADTLNNTEFNQFVDKLFEAIPKQEIMIKSLFHLMVYEGRVNQNKYINKINETMTKMMHLKRENEINSIDTESDTNSTQNEPISFNDIPQSIISEIASYLKLNELSSFFKSDRYIYISCKSIPTTFTSLMKTKWFTKYSMNYGELGINHQHKKLNQFKMIKNLFVSSELITKTKWIWTNLDRACFFGIDDNFNVSNIIQNTNIKQLILKRIHRLTQLNINNIWNAICCNKSIQFLSIDSNLINMAQNEPINHLKGLKIEIFKNEEIINLDRICSKTINELQSIHITSDRRLQYALNGKIGSNIKEIHIKGIDHYDLEKFIKAGTKTKLQRMHWKIRSFVNYQNVLKTVLNKVSTLNYLYVDTSDSVKKAMNPIIDILECNVERRDNFKLELNLNMNEDIDFIEHNLDKIIKSIKYGVNNDFMIIFNFKNSICLKPQMEHKFILYGLSNNDIGIKITDKSKMKRIVICNIDNTMCGYKERWIAQYDTINVSQCFVCHKTENAMRCSQCKNAFYCSREHQIADWSRHSMECQPS